MKDERRDKNTWNERLQTGGIGHHSSRDGAWRDILKNLTDYKGICAKSVCKEKVTKRSNI